MKLYKNYQTQEDFSLKRNQPGFNQNKSKEKLIMAKASKSIAFKNATINKEDGAITEYMKEETNVYSIDKLLSDWNHVDGVSLTIKKDDEVPSEE